MKNKNGFWRITFDTNPNDCNLYCIMCEHHSRYSNVENSRILANKPKEQMDIELIRRVLESTRNSQLQEIIPSTMGEPLLYKDFEQIIELCKEFGVKLNLTTNGTFPIKGTTSWAKLIIPIASDVKISWNGATKSTQEKIMQGLNFEKGIQNIKDFLKIRDDYANGDKNYCQVTLQLTFMEINLQELEDIVRLAISLGIDRIKGHHLWTHFTEIEQLSLRRNAISIARWNEVVLKIKKIAVENLLLNGKHISLVNFDILEIGATKNLMPDGICPFLGKGRARNNFGISGQLKSSSSLPASSPNVQRLTGIIEDHLGQDFKMIKNKSGDPVFISKDNLKRIRFDAKNPHGDVPHGHIEYYDAQDKRWLDYTREHRIYLKDAMEYLNPNFWKK